MASDLSNMAQAASSVTSTLTAALDSSSARVLADAMNTTGADAATARQATSWLGLFGWLVYHVLNLVSTILYWAARIVTISVPKLLFAMFSTSWTVTMNATTLYAFPRTVVSGISWLTRCLACSSWRLLFLRPAGS